MIWSVCKQIYIATKLHKKLFQKRMDNFHRLAYTLSIHLRNYKMITGSTFLENLIDNKWVSERLLKPQTPITNSFILKACLLISVLPSLFIIGSIIYTAGTALMRYLCVSQIVNPGIQKNNVAHILLIPHILLFFHSFNSVRYFINHGDHPFLLYHACIDPYSFYDIPIFKLLIIDNVMIFFYQVITVLGNIYVWIYLRGHTENNMALKEVDKKKERKRNFVPAKNGIRTAMALIFSYFYHSIFYGFEVKFYSDSQMRNDIISIIQIIFIR